MKKIIATAAVVGTLLGAAPVASADTGTSGRSGSSSSSSSSSAKKPSAERLPSPSDIFAGIKRLFNQSPSVGRSGR